MVYMLSFLFLFAAAVSLTGWGSLVVRRERSWPGMFGLGTILVFLLVTLLGWAGLLREPVLWGILVLGAVFWVRPGKAALPRGLGWLAMAAGILLPLALLPPISRDAMSHHLMLPRIWLEAGRIIRPEWSKFFSYPYLVETLYALCGGTFGFMSSRMVSLLGFFAACSVPVVYYLRRERKRTALISLLILLSIPELLRNATWSYSDSFLVFFSLLAYLELTREEGSPLMAVLWAGAAACCKYNGVVVLVTVCAALPFRFRRMPLRTLLTCGGIALGMCLTWALPNLVQWGNPVYPLFRSLFGPVTHFSARGAEYLASNSFTPAVTGPLDYILLPVRMSISGRWDDPSLFDGASGPLLLAGTVLAVALVRGRRRKLLPPLVYLVLAVVLSGTAVRTRYLLPGLAMLALPAAEAVSGLFDRGRGGSSTTRMLVALLLGLCMLWTGGRLLDLYRLERPWRLPDTEEYLETSTGYYPFFSDCAAHLGDSDTTLLVNMDRPFYFPAPARTTGYRVPVELLEYIWTGSSSQAMAESLMSQGFSHVCMDMLYTSMNLTSRLSGDEKEIWREFAASRLEPVVSSGRYVLFRIAP